MRLVEIKIDRKTLPKNGQKIKWQTYEDFNNNEWKEGVFSSGDDLFCVGFEFTPNDWDLSFKVLHWIPL